MSKLAGSGETADGKGGDRAPDAAVPHRPASYTAEELAELERRERMGGWLLLFFGGAAIATAALAFYLFSGDVEPNEEYVRIDREQQAGAVDDTPFNWGQAPADPVDTETKAATGGSRETAVAGTAPKSESPVVPIEEPTPAPPPPPSEPAAPTFAGPPPGSVDRETARALRSGETQLWREKGQRGYVLVSEAVTYGSRECRQVSYTRFEEGRQASSPSAQWCRASGSSKWRPDPRGPE